IFDEIEANFSSHGFRTLDDPVILPDANGDGLDEVNPAIAGVPLDQIAFFDVVHPTAALHNIMAGFQAAALTKDFQKGTSNGDALRGSRTDDLILGNAGDDHIRLRDGDDIGLGGQGHDYIKGGRGDDLLGGGGGHDHLRGGSGNDIIGGGDGSDRTSGGSGDDLIIDGDGNDRHWGGSGDDTFVYTEASLMGWNSSGFDVIHGNRGDDTLILRVEDADAVSSFSFGSISVYGELGLITFGIENVEVVEGTDLTARAFYDEQLATADLWNFV
ncbi:MAG: hypothetical protein AAF666_20770, partial [Pseudomonadota bacterium]